MLLLSAVFVSTFIIVFIVVFLFLEKYGMPKRKTKCERKGHDWFLYSSPREFTPTIDMCYRNGCDAQRVVLPWGECMGATDKALHPMTDHYILNEDHSQYTLTPTKKCLGPW